MIKYILGDIDAAIARDPAAGSRLEVGLLYPGIQAIFLYRVANYFWNLGGTACRFTGRAISQLARWLTGIEIHPGAKIGERFFIDHGMGVVIGETSIIGNDVTLYHGVTLGGVAPSVDSDSQRNTKRHPTLEDGVIVGSGGQVLGPITVGKSARVGANAVVTKDVPPDITVVGVPAKSLAQRKSESDLLRLANDRLNSTVPENVAARKDMVTSTKTQNKKGGFVPYGTPCGGAEVVDPEDKELLMLKEEMLRLRERLTQLEIWANVTEMSQTKNGSKYDQKHWTKVE